jgi:hypothetical protein
MGQLGPGRMMPLIRPARDPQQRRAAAQSPLEKAKRGADSWGIARLASVTCGKADLQEGKVGFWVRADHLRIEDLAVIHDDLKLKRISTSSPESVNGSLRWAIHSVLGSNPRRSQADGGATSGT